jgi:hypothetical protein
VVLYVHRSALDLLMRRWWASTALGRQEVHSLGALFPGVEARVELREARVLPRRADGGRVRISTRMRVDLRFGTSRLFGGSLKTALDSALPMAAERIDLACTVLVEPRVEREADARVRLAVDFADAQVEDLQVRSRYANPLGLDMAPEAMSAQIGELAVRGLLERVGERGAVVGGPTLARLMSPIAGELGLTVGDGYLELGCLGDAPSAPAWLEREEDDSARAPADPIELRVGQEYLGSLIETSPAGGAGTSRWRLERPEVRLGPDNANLTVRVHPRAAPRRLGGRVTLTLCPRLKPRALGMDLDALTLVAPRGPRWLERLLHRALRWRIHVLQIPRELALPLPLGDDEPCRLRLGRIRLEPQNVRLGGSLHFPTAGGESQG